MSSKTSVRLHVPAALAAGLVFTLPPGPSRHAQVLRLQPGDDVRLFNGEGGEWAARIVRMGRQAVDVEVSAFHAVDREAARPVLLALGMPANDRMDTVVEKATELGVHALQPLVCERSVLRLSAERAERKVGHWQGVATAAAEQCGRTRVPVVAPVRELREWLSEPLPADDAPTARLLLSLAPGARTLPALGLTGAEPVVLLSGPEGGLTPAEEALALARGWTPVILGARTLRADTAPLAALAWLMLQSS